MADALEAELDRLFELLPGELVSARNALADRFRKAGDREAATRVLAVKRAAPAAWAINQVHFREPAVLARALAHAAELRELQAADGVDGKRLSAAVDAQRTATQAVVEAAIRHCEAAGINAGPAQQRKIFTTVQSWLAGTSAEPPGRMTREVEPSGFDAIGSVGLVLPLPAPAPGAAEPSAEVTAPAPEVAVLDPRAIERATDQLAVCERDARRAVDEARAREAEHKQAEHELARAKLRVRDAERELVQLRASLAQRESEHVRTQRAIQQAAEVQRASEDAVGRARTELARLRSPRRGS